MFSQEALFTRPKRLIITCQSTFSVIRQWNYAGRIFAMKASSSPFLRWLSFLVRVVKHHMVAFLFRRGNSEWGRRWGYLLHYLRKSGLLRWSLLSFWRGYRGGGSYVSRNDSSRTIRLFIRETESNLTIAHDLSDIFIFLTFMYFTFNLELIC